MKVGFMLLSKLSDLSLLLMLSCVVNPAVGGVYQCIQDFIRLIQPFYLSWGKPSFRSIPTRAFFTHIVTNYQLRLSL